MKKKNKKIKEKTQELKKTKKSINRKSAKIKINSHNDITKEKSVGKRLKKKIKSKVV